MRDLLMFAVFFGFLPLVPKRPWIGVMLWTWIGIMNPHRQCFGPAFDFPFAYLVGLATLVGLAVSPDRKHFPVNGITLLIIFFVLWMCVTSAFALHPDLIGEMFGKVMKIMVMVFVTMILIQSRKHIDILIWVMVLSLGYYGVKGGIYTIETAGGGRVWGPSGSFIQGNNELAIALVMMIPLAFYLYSVEQNKWRKRFLLAVMGLSAISVLGSQSRGGFLAIACMSLVLWARSRHKILMGVVMTVMAFGLLIFMPESWHTRMDTVKTYEQDGSAMGRINAWTMAYNLASDRWIGGGFRVDTHEEFEKYAPDPTNPLAAHSIYFQVLGEHGFFGLFLFLSIWGATWLGAAQIRKRAAGLEDCAWMVQLAAMIQVSFVGYLVGGAFLSLAYFDVAFNMAIIIVLCRELLRARLKEQSVIGSGSHVPPVAQPNGDWVTQGRPQ